MLQKYFLLLGLIFLLQAQQIAAPAKHQPSTFTIPFVLKQDFILVEVKIEGILPLQFIFDTGAENTILFDRIYTDLLNVEYDMRLPIMGSNLRIGNYALVTRDIGFQIEGHPVQPLDILVLEEFDPKLKEYLGEEIHGIIGHSFFKNHIIEIDYKRQFIKLHRPSTFEMRSVRKFIPLKIEIKKGKPYLNTTIALQQGDSVEVLLLLDTGAGINLLLHSNTHEQFSLPEKTITGELGIGVSGILEGFIGRIHEFRLGPISYKSMITSFQDLDSTFIEFDELHRNGIIGNSLLRRFHVIIDYQGSMLYIKPEKGYKDDFKYDRSGLTVIASGPELDEYRILSVMPGSPADSTGLKAGDRILKIQHWPSYFYTLSGINKLFKKKEGKKVRLKVEREGEKMRFNFRLQKLI